MASAQSATTEATPTAAAQANTTTSSTAATSSEAVREGASSTPPTQNNSPPKAPNNEATWFSMAVEREVDETCLPACSASFEDPTAAAEIDDNVEAKSAPLMSNVSLCSNVDEKFDCKALLDTGAVRCFIKKAFLDSLPSEYVLARKSGSYSVTVADNRRFNSDESVLLKIATPQKTVSSWCIVYPSLAFPLILGLSCMRDLSLLLYLSHDQILLRADTLESDVRSLASKKDSDGVEGSQKAGCTKPSDNDSSARYHNDSELTIDGYNAKDGVSGEEGSHLSFLMVDANHSEVWELDATDPWNIEISVRSPDYSSRDYSLSVVDSEDPASSDYNVTVYKGLTSDSHIDEHGSVIGVKRFTYGIPWVSDKRLPKPTVGDIDKVIASDSSLAKRLQDCGLFDKYSKVFDEYVRRNILVKVDPSDYHKVTGIIPHYPIISTTSKSTPVRPVLRGSQYRNIIGSGLGAVKSPRDAILRSTMPSILTFRAFSYVAVLDLEKAFYMLRNSVDVAFLFCLPWKGALYRMTAPPMGAPHSAAALLHAMQLMCDEAYQLFKSRHPEIPDGECCVAFSPYMDDLIVGAASQSLLVEAIDCLLTVCKSHGFNCQESKRGVGPPSLKPRKVLGLLWHPDDKVGNQEGPLLPPILRSEECAKSIVSLTQRDVVSWIAKFYDPCGISNHILLSMRLCLRGEANTNPDVDAFISASTFKSLKELMESFRQAPPIPRLLTILPYRIVYCFADSSVYATANVITDSVLNPIVCHSRLIDRNRMSWSIVRKELLACLQVLHSFRDMMKALNSILPDAKIRPTLFTDNEANYFRIRKAVAIFPDVEPLLKDMPKWEVNTLSAIAEILNYFDGSVHHVAGKLNLSDVYSRGSAQPPPFLDQSLLETIHNACRRRESSAQSPNTSDDSKNCGRDDYLLILDDVISDDLKNNILREQRLDPILKPFFDQSGPISPRVLRKYELVDDDAADDDDGQSYVRNRVTGAIAVPSKLCKEVAEALHNYFGHINHYRLFRTVIDRYDCGKTVTDTHQWMVENLETALRSRDVYNATQMMRSDFNRLNVGDKVVSDIYVVVGIRGVIAAIAISPTDNNVKYEYIGNLKKIMDDEDNED
ncbi:hypothetical protein FOZ60_001498 [Perkinsus olseni]|uniref:Reverse transcriptase domain-containing protein n=1 Tax=Perkinsus olseni TaxID=32597 RepID=A0A7J6P1D8_PEROL|nr:hypothetical protein FOZ60_001498 [Perkinsus olseni]